MKKRFFSALLAVLMLITAMPAVLPAVASETGTELTAPDYDALYVTDGLIYALDFYSLNEYWGGTATLPVPPADTFQGEKVADGKLTAAYQTEVNAYKKSLTDLFAGFVTYSNSTIATVQQTPSVGTQSYHDQTGNNQRASFTLGQGYITLTHPHANCFVHISSFPQEGTITEEAVIAAGSAESTNQFITLRDLAVRLDAKTELFAFSGFTAYNGSAAYALDSAFTLKATVDTPLTLTITDQRVVADGAATHTASMWVNGALAIENAQTVDSNAGTANTMFGYQCSMASKVYAFRFYNRTLSDAERAQNHFADLAKWFRLDVSQLSLVDTKTAIDLYEKFADMSFETPRDTVVATYVENIADAIYGGLYEGLTAGTPEYAATDAFVQRAAAHSLSVSLLAQLPVEDRLAVYAMVAEYEGNDPAELQLVLDLAIEALVDEKYGEYIDKTVYDYRDLYVKQEYLETAIDFFAATPEDGNVYVGVSYDSWVDEYNAIKSSWSSSDNIYGRVFASQNEAVTYARENRLETVRPDNWNEMLETYLWKGDAANLQPLDISDRNYPHTNIRTYGDGRLICTLNNSLTVKYSNDDTDVSYQVVTKASGSPNWQLLGFRAGFGFSGDKIAFTSMNYNAFGVNATTGAVNNSTLHAVSIPYENRYYADATYSTDLTVVADKKPGTDPGHYYHYALNESTGKYEFTEVATEKEANSGLVTYYGRFDLSLYSNGHYAGGMTDMPYTAGGSHSVGNSGANEFFAVRVYSCTLTEADIMQNHFADLAGYYGFNLSLYYRLTPAERLLVHEMLQDLPLGASREASEDAYLDAISSLYYELGGDTPEYESFRALARAYTLDVTTLRTLSPLTRQRLYAMMAADGRYTADSVWFPALLQSHLEGYVAQMKEEYYAESVVHALTEHLGYQLKKGGDAPGMRALFSLDKDQIETLLAAYDEIDLTLGMMMLPADDTSRVTVADGKVVLPATAIATVTAYEKGAYTSACFEWDGEPVYACEFFPEDVKTKVSYLGYAVITIPGEDPIIFHIDPATSAVASTFSLYDLTRYAKTKLSLAYENIQKVMNEQTGRDDVVLSVGTGNIGEYVIYAGQNTADVEYLQNMLKDKVGITLKVVTDFELANYDRVIYLGNYDTVVEDEALYGLALRGKSLHLWSKVDANTKLSIDILGEYLAYAENGNGSAHIVSGTDIIRRNRGE
ncbi:MAG: hypothetical protein J6T24_03530 [Clostridia bacterium]|nr:hypothetical protein [Clostridia bacterium]